MNKDTLNTNFSLEHRQFTFPNLRMITARSDKTLRNWLSRYFKEFGEQTGGRRYLFSAAECIVLRIFSELISNFSIPPEIGSQIVSGLVTRIEYLHSLPAQTTGYEPEYLVIHEITATECGFSMETREGIADCLNDSDLFTALIIPVDGHYWRSIVELEIILGHYRELTVEDVRSRASKILKTRGGWSE